MIGPTILEQEDALKSLPTEALQQMMRQPSPNAPPFLVAAELKRREQMAKEFAGKQAEAQTGQNAPTVAHRLAGMQQPVPMSQVGAMAAAPRQPPMPQESQLAMAMSGATGQPPPQLPTVNMQRGTTGAAMQALVKALQSERTRTASQGDKHHLFASERRPPPVPNDRGLAGLIAAIIKQRSEPERAYGGFEIPKDDRRPQGSGRMVTAARPVRPPAAMEAANGTQGRTVYAQEGYPDEYTPRSFPDYESAWSGELRQPDLTRLEAIEAGRLRLDPRTHAGNIRYGVDVERAAARRRDILTGLERGNRVGDRDGSDAEGAALAVALGEGLGATERVQAQSEMTDADVALPEGRRPWTPRVAASQARSVLPPVNFIPFEPGLREERLASVTPEVLSNLSGVVGRGHAQRPDIFADAPLLPWYASGPHLEVEPPGGGEAAKMAYQQGQRRPVVPVDTPWPLAELPRPIEQVVKAVAVGDGAAPSEDLSNQFEGMDLRTLTLAGDSGGPAGAPDMDVNALTAQLPQLLASITSRGAGEVFDPTVIAEKAAARSDVMRKSLGDRTSSLIEQQNDAIDKMAAADKASLKKIDASFDALKDFQKTGRLPQEHRDALINAGLMEFGAAFLDPNNPTLYGAFSAGLRGFQKIEKGKKKEYLENLKYALTAETTREKLAMERRGAEDTARRSLVQFQVAQGSRDEAAAVAAETRYVDAANTAQRLRIAEGQLATGQITALAAILNALKPGADERMLNTLISGKMKEAQALAKTGDFSVMDEAFIYDKGTNQVTPRVGYFVNLFTSMDAAGWSREMRARRADERGEASAARSVSATVKTKVDNLMTGWATDTTWEAILGRTPTEADMTGDKRARTQRRAQDWAERNTPGHPRYKPNGSSGQPQKDLGEYFVGGGG